MDLLTPSLWSKWFLREYEDFKKWCDFLEKHGFYENEEGDKETKWTHKKRK